MPHVAWYVCTFVAVVIALRTIHERRHVTYGMELALFILRVVVAILSTSNRLDNELTLSKLHITKQLPLIVSSQFFVARHFEV